MLKRIKTRMVLYYDGIVAVAGSTANWTNCETPNDSITLSIIYYMIDIFDILKLNVPN